MEQLLVLNPRRRKRRANPRNAKGRFVSRRKNPRRRRRNPIAALAANPRRRRRRRNPIAALAANPRRRRRRNPIAALAANPRRRRRRNPNKRWGAVRAHKRRVNPRLLSVNGLKQTLFPAAIGGAGALTLDVALGYVPVPEALDNTWGRLGIKIAGALALGYGASFVTSKHNAKLFTAGALTVIAYGGIRDGLKNILPPDVVAKIPGLTPFNGTETYDLSDLRMGYVNPAPMLQGQGMGAYMDRTGMGAYMRPAAELDTVNQVNGYMSDGM